MLIAKNSTEINAPVKHVWEVFTQPDVPQKWVDAESSTIVSSWKQGDAITWKTKTGGDYARGTITECVTEKTIAYDLHDAEAEDGYDPDFDEMWNTDHWKFSFESNGEKTKLTLTVGDYDIEHETNEEHDHAEAESTCEDMAERVIPEILERIKVMCENN